MRSAAVSAAARLAASALMGWGDRSRVRSLRPPRSRLRSHVSSTTRAASSRGAVFSAAPASGVALGRSIGGVRGGVLVLAVASFACDIANIGGVHSLARPGCGRAFSAPARLSNIGGVRASFNSAYMCSMASVPYRYLMTGSSGSLSRRRARARCRSTASLSKRVVFCSTSAAYC